MANNLNFNDQQNVKAALLEYEKRCQNKMESLKLGRRKTNTLVMLPIFMIT